MTTLINLTPHSLTLHGDGIVTIPPSGIVARLSVQRKFLKPISIDGVELPVSKSEFGSVQDLPKPQDGTLYVVSAMVAGAVNRADVFSPGELVRDAKGDVIGAKGLTAYA